MSPSSSQSLPAGKDPPDTTNPASPVTSPRLPHAPLQPSGTQDAQDSTMARPPFTPFFTLVDDATTSSTHHPVNVRYIFSDDDQDLTDDYLAAISSPSPNSSSHITHSDSSSLTTSSRHHQPSNRDPREPEHRTILVDLDATGTAVAAAHSLSSSWQVLSASITKAPTWESGPAAEDEEGGAGAARFMLRLEGTKGRDEGMRERVRGMWREDPGDVRAEDFQVLMDEFEKKMRVLKTVVDSGNEALALGVEEQQDEGHDEDEGENEEEGEAAAEAEAESKE
ncbi:hypothetical protein V494_04952 [Pseudogymnoascus sp. VKM F-4513 (FW-928)]|nr:hypothetical protein V494_04952 [Pseudogymnoascus sp. VKM F-4513 (FW-928)]